MAFQFFDQPFQRKPEQKRVTVLTLRERRLCANIQFARRQQTKRRRGFNLNHKG